MWNKSSVIGWFVYLGVGAAFEIWSNFNGSPKTPTLTDIAVEYLPAWLIVPVLGWALVHFVANYTVHQGWTSKGFRFFTQN